MVVKVYKKQRINMIGEADSLEALNWLNFKL